MSLSHKGSGESKTNWSTDVLDSRRKSRRYLSPSRLTVNSEVIHLVVQKTEQRKEAGSLSEIIMTFCRSIAVGFVNKSKPACVLFWLCVPSPRFYSSDAFLLHSGRQMMFKTCHGLSGNPMWSRFNMLAASLSAIWCIILRRHEEDGKPEWRLKIIMLAVISADLSFLNG